MGGTFARQDPRDVVGDKLEPLGFAGSERTVRRAVATVKGNYRAGRRRVYRP